MALLIGDYVNYQSHRAIYPSQQRCIALAAPLNAGLQMFTCKAGLSACFSHSGKTKIKVCIHTYIVMYICTTVHSPPLPGSPGSPTAPLSLVPVADPYFEMLARASASLSHDALMSVFFHWVIIAASLRSTFPWFALYNVVSLKYLWLLQYIVYDYQGWWHWGSRGGNRPSNIRESVDSLCRDGSDTPIVHVH